MTSLHRTPSGDAPDPTAAVRPSRRFRRRKPAVVAAVLIASLLGSVAVGARSNDPAGYRTATAGTHEVDQVLATVGTIEPVSQASVAFPVDGTVSSVAVEVGDTVTVGQELAALDVDDLTVTLHEKQATLEQAELTLSLALAGEDVTATAGGSPSGGLGRSATSGSSAELTAAQQAVLDAQEAVDAALVDAQAAYDAAVSVCTTADLESTTTTTTTTEDAAADTTSSTDDLSACQAALQASLAAQQDVTTAQKALSEASAALTSLLEDLASDTSTTTTTTTTGSSGSADPTGSTGSSGSGSSPSGSVSSDASGATSATGSSPSAEELIAYQKAVDAAALQVTVAEQAVAQATIVSPIEGTVVSVGLAVGDDATAASSTQTIVVVGDGGAEVTTSVSVSDLPDIEVGQAAAVTPDGSGEEIAGEVVRIGAAADDSSGTSTYTVTISLTGDTSDLGNGSTASVEITTDAAGEALAVPTSAVSVDGDEATVSTVEDGDAKTTTVEVGAVGQTYTEITSGLEAGDEVILADLDAALPTAATDTSSSSSTSAGGGFPGGGTGGPPSGMPGN